MLNSLTRREERIAVVENAAFTHAILPFRANRERKALLADLTYMLYATQALQSPS